MIREKDFVELTIKKMLNDFNKGVIRRFYPPQIAAQKCNAIDAWEKMEHFMRFANEMKEWGDKVKSEVGSLKADMKFEVGSLREDVRT